MSSVASRDLRNHTAEVLRRVADGTSVTITVNGRPVAELGPVRSSRSLFLTRTDLSSILSRQADPGLADDLARLGADTTDDLDPL